jgi:RNA-directed DNA polymerase
MFKKKEPWFRRRGYLHFDRPIGYDSAQNIVSSKTHIEKRSFFPFLTFKIISTKVKWDANLHKLVTNPKERKVAYASHIDSHIYSYYASILSKQYETEILKSGLSENILAFRALDKSNINFAADAFDAISKIGECHALGLDIKGFFDTLNHGILKNAWATVLGTDLLPKDHYAVFKAVTKYSQVELDDVLDLLSISKHNPKSLTRRLCSPEEFRNKVRASGLIQPHKDIRGIPQGSPISALLSNIYMLEFDKKLAAYVKSLGGKYFRYCDDMLFVVPISEKHPCLDFATETIKELKLEIQNTKTERRDFTYVNGYLTTEKPLQYLGFLFDGERIHLRSASLARYAERVRKGIKLAKATMKKRNQSRVARGNHPLPLFMNRLIKRYTFFGRRNFVSYGYRAARIMNSSSIRKQLRPLWRKFQNAL